MNRFLEFSGLSPIRLPKSAKVLRACLAPARSTWINPCCLEDPRLGIHRLFADVEKAEVVGLAVERIDIKSAGAFLPT